MDARTDPTGKRTLLLTYAEGDGALVDEFRRHVTLLERQGRIELLDPHRVPAGEEPGVWLPAALGRCDLHVVFHSSDLYRDDRAYDQLLVALERRARGEARLLPLLLRRVGIADPALAGLQHLPRGETPIGELGERARRDRVWSEIVQELVKLLPLAPAPSGGGAIPSRHLRSSASAGGRSWLLLFSANPLKTSRLALDREIDQIAAAIEENRQPPRSISSVWATRYDQLQPEIVGRAPDLLQFSGHGESDGRILLETPEHEVHPLFPEAVVGLFTALEERRRPGLVVFNLCHSAELARAVSRVTGYAIGVDGAWAARSAPHFAAALYSRLALLAADRGAGEPPDGAAIRQAFHLALNQLQLGNLPDSIRPDLFYRGRKVPPGEGAPADDPGSEEGRVAATPAERPAAVQIGGIKIGNVSGNAVIQIGHGHVSGRTGGAKGRR